MKRFSSLILFFIPLVLFSQSDTSSKGIKWITCLSWKQVLEKAQKESKYILVDCYATWCAPCKAMDREVFSSEKAGAFINENFVSIKIQMDSSLKDNDSIRRWYTIAQNIKQRYNVTVFPTYLFLSYNDEIVHKDVGYKNVDAFINVAKNACNPERQYYTLLSNYKSGLKDKAVMPYLAKTAANLREHEVALIIGQDYIYNYLFKLKHEILYSKENVSFMSSFIKNTEEKAFKLFYENPNEIDSAMDRNGYAQQVVDYYIWKEMIKPIIDTRNNDNPSWKILYNRIKIKFDTNCARRNVLSTKVWWYKNNGDWPKYIKNMIIKVERYGAFGLGMLDFDLNNHAWEVFLYSKKKRQLYKALAWSKRAIKINPKYSNSFDTYANILYKLGKRLDAIDFEKRAIQLDPSNKAYEVALKKMENREPTWNLQNSIENKY